MVHLLVCLVVEEEMYFCAVYWVILSKCLLKLCLLCSAALLTVEELLAEEATSVIPTAHGAQAENRSHYISL